MMLLWKPLAASQVWRTCWFYLFLFAALSVFAHGCHGDEDHELVAAATTVVK
ncbi:MAG: hypothetical protein ACJ8F7_03870 [Gemmataceae bacterium]